MKKKTIEGYNMWLEPTVPGISDELYRKGGREFAFMSILREEAVGCDVAYDIGANIGYTTISLADRCKTVHAFEPDKRSRRLLRKNCELWPNVIIHKEAVTDYCGNIKLGLSKKPNQSGIFFKGVKKKVDCVTLDTYAKFSDESVFIKMDIEGAEVSALRGAKKIFESNSKVKILLELHPKQYGPKNDFKETIDMLKGFGFKMKYVVNAKGYLDIYRKRAVKEFYGYERVVAKPAKIDESLCYEMPYKTKVLRSVLWVRE